MVSLRVLLAIDPIWDSKLRLKGEKILIRMQNVTKAYFQSIRTKRLIYYKPPKEAIDDYSNAWKSVRNLYGEVEAGRYCQYRTASTSPSVMPVASNFRPMDM